MGVFGIRREATVFAQVEIVGSLATVAKRVMGWVVCHPVSTVVAVVEGALTPRAMVSTTGETVTVRSSGLVVAT